MNKDVKKNHYYFLFLHRKEEDKAIYIYIKKWLVSAFLRAFIQLATTYRLKVNNVRMNYIVDPMINKGTYHIC